MLALTRALGGAALAAGLIAWGAGLAGRPAAADDEKADSQPAAQDESPKGDREKGRKDEQRMIIVGPDGKMIDVPADRFRLRGQRLGGDREAILQWLAQSSLENPESLTPPKFVIGVGVMDVPAVVWSQLRREPQPGVVVAKLMDDAPAQGAGVQENDIILQANDEEIADQRALIGAIEKAGETPVRLLLLRGGEEVAVEVTPRANDAADPLGHKLTDPQLRPWTQDRVHAFGPGVLWTDKAPADLRQELDSLRKQVEELQKSMDELKKSR